MVNTYGPEGWGEAAGRYRLRATLGMGAMGVVHAAYDPELARHVAIKVVRGCAGEASLSGQMRLLREGWALARVAHPNVVALHDVGIFESGIFLVMELVVGPTLHAWLREAQRAPEQILEVFLSAGEGLSAIHAAGLVHRDFKPSNVLLGDDGRARVADLGLAIRSGEAEEEPEHGADGRVEPAGLLSMALTDPANVPGTPAFMAPEQAKGEDITPAVDQFAFCVSLFQALHRVHPFGRGKPTAAAAASADDLERTEHGCRGIPERVRRAVRRGLSITPEDRFPSMRSLIEELSLGAAEMAAEREGRGTRAEGRGAATEAGSF